MSVIHCGRCRKMPHEIQEYVQLAEESKYRTPAVAVIHEEGTYNRATGKFLCTNCYIAEGMPTGVCKL